MAKWIEGYILEAQFSSSDLVGLEEDFPADLIPFKVKNNGKYQE
jgi:hypothetical protein